MIRFTPDGPFELIPGTPERVGQPPEPFEAFCASLDILGFKDALDALGSQGLARAYGEALSLTNFALKGSANLVREYTSAEFDHDPDLYWGYHTFQSRPLFGMVNAPSVFSDAMFITTKDCSSTSLTELTDYCNAVFQIFLAHKLPMRGVIARGEVLVWNELNLLLGQGIVKAYLLQEAVQIVGIVASAEIGDQTNLGANIELPNKAGEKTPFRLLSPLRPPLTQLVGPSKEELMHHYQELQRAAEDEGDDRVIRKYVNGIPVVESILG